MTVLLTLRTCLIEGFKNLPTLITSLLLFLSLGLFNVSLLILLFGETIILPIIYYFSMTFIGSPPSPEIWLPYMSLFFGHILTNAVLLYYTKIDTSRIQGATAPTVKKSIEDKIKLRKEKSISIIIYTVIFFIVLMNIRYFTEMKDTSVRSYVIYFIYSLLYFGVGAAWYLVFALPLGIQNTDMFGIGIQMMSPDQGAARQMTCIYKATTSTISTRT